MASNQEQRTYSAPCPGCGAPVNFASAQASIAVCPYCRSTVAREGEVLTVSNLRHFRWRTEEDYDQRWETRRYNLATVTGADVFLTYWSGEAIAHLSSRKAMGKVVITTD